MDGDTLPTPALEARLEVPVERRGFFYANESQVDLGAFLEDTQVLQSASQVLLQPSEEPAAPLPATVEPGPSAGETTGQQEGGEGEEAVVTVESITSARKAAAAALLEQQLSWQQERQRQVDSWEEERRAAPASPPESPSPCSSPEVVPQHAHTTSAEGTACLSAAVSEAGVEEAAEKEETEAEADGTEAEAAALAATSDATAPAPAALTAEEEEAAAAEAAKQAAIEREVRARQTPERRAADGALRKSMAAAEPNGLRATLEVVREAARPELVVAAEEELEALEAAGRERDLKLDGAAARAAERHRASYHAAHHHRPSSAAPTVRAAMGMRRKTAGDAPEPLPRSASLSAKGQRRWGAAKQTVNAARAFGGRPSYEAEAEAERVYVGLPAYEPWLGSDYSVHTGQPRLEAFNRHVAERLKEHQRRDEQTGYAAAGAGAGVSVDRQASLLLSIGGGAARRGPRRRAHEAELGYLDLWDAAAAERLQAEYEQWASRRRLNTGEARIKDQPLLPLHPTGAARRAAAAAGPPPSVGLLEQQLAALALRRDESVVLASAELLGRLALNEPSADLTELLDSCGFGPATAAADANAEEDADDDAGSEANTPGGSPDHRSGPLPSPAAGIEAKYWRQVAEQPRHLSASAPPARRYPSEGGYSPASTRGRLARAVRAASAVAALSGRSSSSDLGGLSMPLSISTSALDTMVTTDSFDLKRGGRGGAGGA